MSCESKITMIGFAWFLLGAIIGALIIRLEIYRAQGTFYARTKEQPDANSE